MKLSYRRLTVDVPLLVMVLLKRKMRWVRAAGCVVQDEEGNMLLIRRNGRWDLPKGKVEPGETLLQAALRETTEETGLQVVNEEGGVRNEELLATASNSSFLIPHSSLLVKTYHIYNLYGGWHLKQTSWFRACCAGVKPCGKAQQEEGITDVVWVTPEEWRNNLMHSYGTMKIIARKLG